MRQNKKLKSFPADPPVHRHELTSEWSGFPVLTIACFVCRECLHESGGDGVLRLIDSFLDTMSGTLTLSKGYTCSGGSLRLLQYLAVHESKTMDMFLRRWEVNVVTGQMAARGDLQSLKWITESYLPGEFLTEVVAQASANGHVDILQWMWENHHEVGYWGGIELCGAIRNRHFRMVEWLQTHVAFRLECAQHVIKQAAASGNLKVVKWLYESFGVALDDAAKIAALNCEWKVIRWILGHGKRADLNAALRCDDIYVSAAKSGNIDTLELLSDHGFPGDPMVILDNAISGGHLHIVKWLHEKKGASNVGNGYIEAARNGHLEILKYLHEKQFDVCSSVSAIDTAAAAGCLEVVQWLHSNTPTKCTNQAMDGAASEGHLHIVQWLHRNRTEGCSRLAMHFAAENGYLHVVKWLHANRSEGCFALTIARAAEHGHLEVVAWLYENRGEGFDFSGVMDRVALNGHLRVLQWLHVNRAEGCTTAAMDAAAYNGDLEIVKWLHENRIEGCSKRAMDGAAMRGHLGVVKWLHANRYEGCSADAIDRAAGNNHIAVVRWLHRHRSQRCTHRAMVWLFKRSRCLETAVYLFSEFPECRTFHLGPECEFAWLEVIQWLLERAPGALEACSLRVRSWNWHLCNYLKNNGWKQTRKEGVFIIWDQCDMRIAH
uniref:Ankyrin repeat-containing domain n=1 Tax=Peronospora matthiolae TaxID=2874970 RepID=A0AAV1TI90_9STRA